MPAHPHARTHEAVAGVRTGLLWALPALAAVLALVVAVEWEQSRWTALFWAGVAVVALATFAVARWQRASALAFLAWLADHEDAVREGGASFQGRAVDGGTVVVRHSVCVSLVVFTVRFPTAYAFAGSSDERRQRAAAALGSLVLGWWGIPLGPIHTVGALIHTARGGTRHEVGELLRVLSQERARQGRPRAGFFARLLALDTNSPAKVAANLAIALVLAFVVTMVAVAVLGGPSQPGP